MENLIGSLSNGFNLEMSTSSSAWCSNLRHNSSLESSNYAWLLKCQSQEENNASTWLPKQWSTPTLCSNRCIIILLLNRSITWLQNVNLNTIAMQMRVHEHPYCSSCFLLFPFEYLLSRNSTWLYSQHEEYTKLD